MDEEKVVNQDTVEVEVSDQAFEPEKEVTSTVIPEDVISEFEMDPEYNVEVDVAAAEAEEAEKSEAAPLSDDTKAEMKKKLALWTQMKNKKRSKLYKAIGAGAALVLGGIAIGVYLSNKDE